MQNIHFDRMYMQYGLYQNDWHLLIQRVPSEKGLPLTTIWIHWKLYM